MDARTALLTAARAKLAEKGFAATSMDEIRRAAEVSNGSLFHHFPTKNHLARALYLEAIQDYQTTQTAVMAKARSAQAGIEGMVAAHIDWVLANRVSARVLVELRDATVVEGDDVDWKKVNAAAFEALRAWIARWVEAGEIIALPFDVWMAVVFAPVLQLTRGWALRPSQKIAPAVRRALTQAAWAAVAKQERKVP